MRAVASKLFLGAATFALTACVSVQGTRLGTGVVRPPVDADAVAIYRNAEQVGAPYEEVALLDAAGDYAYTSEEKMFSKLRQKAGALGANGVILDSISEPSTGAKVAQFFIGTSAERHGKAVAIYVERRVAAK